MIAREQKASVISKFRTHDSDTGSPEVQIAILSERMDNLIPEVNDSRGLIRDLITRVAVLEQKVEDLRTSRQELVRRLWMIFAPLVSGLLGALILYFLGIKK